jgi:PAS domain S-box-containing protein
MAPTLTPAPDHTPLPGPAGSPRPSDDGGGWLGEEARMRIRLAGAALLALAIFLIDTFTPASIQFASLYVLVLLLVGRGADGRAIWFWTGGCLAAAGTTFLLLIDPFADGSADARFAIAVTTIICTAFLISQQSAAMAMVRRQSRALDVAGTAVLLRDAGGEILLWNRAAEELYGWSRREAVGQNADRLLASRLPESMEVIRASLRDRGMWEGEIEHQHRDGRAVTVLSRWTLQPGEGGMPAMIVETDVDAHIQRAAELLRQSELRYRTIFDSLAVAVLEYDFRRARSVLEAMPGQGIHDIRRHLADHPEEVREMARQVRITGANDTAVKLLEAPSKDAFAGGLDEIMEEGDQSLAICLAALAAGEPTFLTETRVRTMTGDLVPVIVMLNFPPDGALERVTGCLVDIRDRLRMQATIDKTRAELDQALRAASLGEVSASIAHEVNQPLSAVMSFANASRRWLNRTPPNIAEARTALDDTILATEHASNVVKRVRKLLGKAEPDRLLLQIDLAVAEATRLIQGEAVANDVAVRLDLGAPGTVMRADRILLQQVLLNLLNNAIQAMDGVVDRERSIQLETRRLGDTIRIRIRDSGPGFADGAADQAFNAFYTTKPTGMGLGLSICRSAIESHGGTIRLENLADQAGAMVTLELPIDA